MMESDETRARAAALESEALHWVNRLLSGAVGAGDAEAFKAWRASSSAHEQAFAEAWRFRRAARAAILETRAGEAPAADGAAQSVAAPVAATAPSARRAIARRPHGPTGRPSGRMTRRALLAGGLAASAAGYMVAKPPAGLWPSWSELTSDYHTGTGQERAIAVAPGVAMELNARTSVARRLPDGGAGVRLVSGEAVVTAHQPQNAAFAVAAGAGRTLVADAGVNIRVDGGSVCVTCLSGAVEIVHPVRRVRVEAGRQVVYTDRSLGALQAVDVAVTTGWRRGVLIFRDAPLQQVVDELNRYRPGKIVLLGSVLPRRPVYGVFQIRNIAKAVDQVRMLTGARATHLPGGLVLLS
jgi:transmembrane sensor